MVHLDVVVAATSAAAADRLARLDAMADWAEPAHRARVVGDVDRLVAALHEWAAVVDGVHLRPAVLQADLTTIVERAVPALRAAGLVRPAAPGATLRDRFALPRPVSRYAGIGN